MLKSAKPSTIAVEELNDPLRFREIRMLKHDELIPFIQEQYKNKTYVLQIYQWCNLLLVAIFLAWGTYVLMKTEYSFSTLLSWTGIGIAISFSIIIMIHEGIHGLAYKWAGAPEISYGGSFKKFYFYAAADQFVVNQRQFTIVALAPFIVVSTLSLLGLFFVTIPETFLLLGLLLMHTMMCGGDFGMINFLLNQEHPVYTYDDMEKKTSWFYEKID